MKRSLFGAAIVLSAVAVAAIGSSGLDLRCRAGHRGRRRVAGRARGEGLNAFGAEWHALSAAGKTVENAGS